MLYIRQHKPTLNTQYELFKLIIRNVQLESSITRDKQKYLKPTKKNNIGEIISCFKQRKKFQKFLNLF